MNRFKEMCISRKMTAVMMLTCGIALLTACSAFLTRDFLRLRGIFHGELSTTAAIVGEGSASALSHRDRDAANRTLSLLRADETIEGAALYVRNSDKALASYYRRGTRIASIETIRQPGIYEESRSVLLVRSVVLNGVEVGTLAVRADKRELATLLASDLQMSVLVLFPCLAIAFLCISILQRGITRPIVRLAETARRIPADGAPAGPVESNDEVSILADTLGILLSKIQDQEVLLTAYRALQQDDAAERVAALERANSELIAVKDRAEEAGRLKDAVLARLSHEVRTPLNGVIAMAQLALETDLTREQTKYIASASRSAESLLRAVDGIVDFSRIETGIILERAEFDISETLYEVMRGFSPLAREKGLALLLDVHADVPSTVTGDRARFRQIMVNLVENALRFTDTGKVTVEAWSVFHSDRVAGLHLKVSDTGRGLTASRFEQALEPFGLSSGGWMDGDAGLGLAISSRLIGMMGGCLWLGSEMGSGSTFHFTATFELSESSVSPPLDLKDLRGATVLVADGNAGTRRILQQLLSLWQMRPVLAASGAEATEMMRVSQATGNPFDIALVDRHMIGLDGSRFAKESGGHPELAGPVIMALSSINKVSVTDLTREFGAMGYLVKPVALSTLLKAVSTAMHTIRGEQRTSVRVNRRIPGKVARILVAEDNLTSETVAVSILIKEGYEVSVARSGIQALAAYDEGGLDMILMDIQMPDMSGLEATREIRLREGTSGRHIPILALTAHAMTGDRERCLEAGMDDYVSKPLQVRALRATVNRWMNCGSPLAVAPKTLSERTE